MKRLAAKNISSIAAILLPSLFHFYCEAAPYSCEPLAKLTVNLDDALLGRYPSAYTPNVPAGCRAEGVALVNKWMTEDKTNFKQLVNRFCSAILGWEENNPGECQAGGPPPICHENHWHKVDPRTAQNSFYDNNRRLAKERENEIRRVECGCYASALRNSYFNNNIKSASTAQQSSNPFSTVDDICTPGGQCLFPGQQCIAGYCRFPGQSIYLQSKIESQGIDKLIDYAKNKSADATKGAIADFLGLKDVIELVSKNFGFALIVGIINPAYIGTPIDAYQNALAKTKADAENLQQLYSEFWRAQNKSLKYRAPQYIEYDIAQAKASLRRNLDSLALEQTNVLHDWLPPNLCGDALSVAHDHLSSLAAAILALPDTIPK